MKVRLEFSRGEEMKYLSHLDLMRTFSRAMRRGGVPVKYTEGFNPHAKMIFGLPLQVGVTGGAEFMDIEADDGAGIDGILRDLNANLPDGLRIAAACETRAKENVMAIINHATYEMGVGLSGCPDLDAELKKAVEAFLLPGARVVEKDSKPQQRRGQSPAAKTLDIAPLVRSIEARGGMLLMTVSAGGVNNLKPDMVLKALNAVYKEINSDGAGLFTRTSLHRKALHVERDGVLYRPNDNEICGC